MAFRRLFARARRRAGRLAFVLTALLGVLVLLLPQAGYAQSGETLSTGYDVPLALVLASAGPFHERQAFNLDIITCVDPSQSVSGIEAYIKYDCTRLGVVDNDYSLPGSQIVPGASLPIVLENTVEQIDNQTGIIRYAAGQPNAPFPTGVFKIATVRFYVYNISSETYSAVSLSMEGPNTTSIVDYGGNPVSGTHQDALIHIIAGGPVNISVYLQGGLRPPAGWRVPLQVDFYPLVSDNQTGYAVNRFLLIPEKSGNRAVAQALGVMPGIYDISVGTPGCLTNIKRRLTIDGSHSDIDMGVLLAGDANQDNAIGIQDFGILAAAFGKRPSEPAFDARADFDLNTTVNISDFGLLAANYGKTGPLDISGDTQHPSVILVRPEHRATGVNVDTVISATFSEALAANTVTADNFTLKNSDGPVPGAVSYNQNSRTATFIPSVPLSCGIFYSACITTGMTDLAGNNLVEPVTWSFMTIPVDQNVTISVGSPAMAAAGSIFTVNINISQVSGLVAYQLKLNYDAGVIEIDDDGSMTTGVAPGLIGSQEMPLDIWGYHPYGTQGIVTILGHLPAPQSATGQGYLTQVHFRAVGASGQNTLISLSQALIFDLYGDEITGVTLQTGTVSIQ